MFTAHGFCFSYFVVRENQSFLMDLEFTLLYVMRGFGGKTNEKEKKAWLSFGAFIKQHLPDNKSANIYEILIAKIQLNFSDVRCNISVKHNFLNRHLHQFPEDTEMSVIKTEDAFIKTS